MALKLSTLHVRKGQRTESNEKHNRIYPNINPQNKTKQQQKTVLKTTLTDNSNLNKAQRERGMPPPPSPRALPSLPPPPFSPSPALEANALPQGQQGYLGEANPKPSL